VESVKESKADQLDRDETSIDTVATERRPIPSKDREASSAQRCRLQSRKADGEERTNLNGEVCCAGKEVDKLVDNAAKKHMYILSP
jgi:hypothetical protein